MKNVYFLLISFTFLILLNACASYKYSEYDKGRDCAFNINSDNLAEFEVIDSNSARKLAKANSKNITVNLLGLKKNNLRVLIVHPNYDTIRIALSRSPRASALAKDISLGVFTFGIPVIIDLFKSDFYKVSKKSKEIKLHFEFRQSYMIEEYEKIKNSSLPQDFNNWLAKYSKSKIYQLVIDNRDSLELTIALSKSKESAIEEFINSHQESNLLDQAKKIKSEMVESREYFVKIKSENTVEAYENYLKKYPKSLQNTEAHKKLVDAAENRAISSKKLSDMVNYLNSYLIPNDQYLNYSEFDFKKRVISEKIDSQLIVENIKQDSKKHYDSYSQLWKAYISLKSNINPRNLNVLAKTETYRVKICNLLFTKLKDINSQESQENLVKKINSDFPNLDPNKPQENPIITILENYDQGNSIVKLHAVGFMTKYFDRISKDNPLNGKNIYTYLDKSFKSLLGITYEELTFKNGHLFGFTKCYNGNALEFTVNMRFEGPEEIGYYQDGKLVKSVYILRNNQEYSYEFKNGVNLTLQNLETQIKESKSYLNSGNFDMAISILENGLNNNIPRTIPQIINLEKNLKITKLKQEEYLKKQEEIRVAENNRQLAIEAEKSKPIILDDYYDLWDYPAKYNGRNIALGVYHSSRKDKSVLHQREYSESKKGGVRNSYFKGSRFEIPESELQTITTYYNWKHFREITTGREILVNIPDKFFDNDLIPHDFGQSRYVIVINVYPITEDRGAGKKGIYNHMIGSGDSKEMTYELVEIKRLKD